MQDKVAKPGAAPALKGIKVLDLTQFEAGPSCTEALAWLGADVVKVEEPNRGEPGRWGFSDRPDADFALFHLLQPQQAQRHLQSQERGRQGAAAADDREGRRPDREHGARHLRAAGLRLSAAGEINPRLIFAQVKGFAPESPHANYLSLRHDRPGDGRHDGRERPSRRSRRSGRARPSAIPAPACCAPWASSPRSTSA